MTVHVLCITSAAGLPLFTRKKGDGDSLPFSVVASLNGVHIYCKSHDVILKNSLTQDTTFLWEEFEESIVLIAAASCSNEAILQKLIKAVFNAIVLLVGVDEIKNIRNPDRLKRELRVCYPLIEKLMDGVDGSIINQFSMGSHVTRNRTEDAFSSPSFNNLLGFSESVLSYESNDMMASLDAYAECMNTQYACLLVCGRELVSTPSWNDLHPLERQLLILLTTVSSPCTSSDTPVFLPFKSPSIPFRLLWLLLVPGVTVLCLCGPTPGLSEAEHMATQCWGPGAEHLTSLLQIIPRNFPHSISLDSNVLGFLLLNVEKGKYVLSSISNDKPIWQSSGKTEVSLEHSAPISAPSANHRLHVLCTFYHQAVDSFLLTAKDLDFPRREKGDSCKKDTALEAYWCSEYHKCHAIRSGSNILCVLFASSVPTHTMRLLSQQTLKILATDKQLLW